VSLWYTATVSENQRTGGGMSYLRLERAPRALHVAHVHPGQYLRLRLPPYGEGMFAIANAPSLGAPGFDLLVKEGSELPDALRALPVGATVEITGPEGPGFPVERAVGKRLLLFATGSGISAIRSVVDAALAERTRFGPVVLYFGVRTPDAFAYEHELDGWRAAGIAVKTTVSQPGRSGWQGLTGYVQAHVGEENVENAVAFVCGQSEMVQGVTEALVRRGLPRELIFLNH
jgi:NAD(P)H-flavin reductase